MKDEPVPPVRCIQKARTRLWLGILLLLHWSGMSLLWAQNSAVFTRLGEKDLFPQDRITALLKDHYGFLWCGTDLGLFRFDGQTVRWYRHDPDEPTTITSGKVRVIQEDAKGRLWVGTNGGLNLMTPEYGTFQRITHQADDPKSLNSDNIWAICIDGDRRVWVGTDIGLNLLENGTVKHFEVEAFRNGVTTIAVDAQGKLWVGTDASGAGSFDPSNASFHGLPMLDGLKVRVILPLAPEQLWVGTLSAGLFRIGDQGWHNYRHNPADPSSLASDSVNSLDRDAQGTLWVGSEAGLCALPKGADRFVNHGHNEANPSSLNASNVTTVYADNDDLLWISTIVGGLNLYDLRRSRFHAYDFQLQGGALAITSLDPNSLWVGSRQGLARLDLATQACQWYLDNATIRTLLAHPQGFLLVGTESRLIKVEVDGMQIKQKTLLEGKRFWRLLADGDQGLWVATNKELLHYRLDTGAVSVIEAQVNSDKHLNHRTITALAYHPDGSLLIGTYGGGLNRLDQHTGLVRHYLKQDGDEQSLSANEITHLLVDRSGQPWLATLTGGLDRMRADGSFERVLRYRDFPDRVFVALSEDKAGNLWILDSFGVIRYNPHSGTYQFFEGNDGASPGAAVPGSCHVSPFDGSLSFGGSDGLVRFNADDFPVKSPAPLVFTNVRIGNVDYCHILQPQKVLALSHQDKTFSLDAHLLDFRAPGRSRIATWRVNLDDGWVWTEGAHASVSYTRYLNLGGMGQLRVRGLDHYGREAETLIVIQVSKPWWMTWLPLLILMGLGLLILLIYLSISFFERRKRRVLIVQARLAEQKRELAEQRAQIAEQQNEVEQRERKLQEMHTTILQKHLEQVSTEIANDLHDGPLASLNGLSFQLRALTRSQDPEQRNSELERISDTMLPAVCGTLRNVCGQLLLPDFRYGLVTELESYADVCTGLYPSLVLHRSFPQEITQIDDETCACLYRIFRTLLKNVGQHSGADEAWIMLQEQDDQLYLEIRDNGLGFQVPTDWEEFRAQKHYGMYMANYFAISLGGKLTVSSDPSNGTCISLRVPHQQPRPA